MSNEIIGECDCCGAKNVHLRECWPMGMETYACAKCRNDPDDEYDHAAARVYTKNGVGG